MYPITEALCPSQGKLYQPLNKQENDKGFRIGWILLLPQGVMLMHVNAVSYMTTTSEKYTHNISENEATGKFMLVSAS